MNKMEEIYQNLTGVNISDQYKLWDERGKGYYGEYLLFNVLYPEIQGCCKILMNLQIPTSNGKTTEIDLLLIHESGLYVFEAKHYKGTIYGTDDQTRWTQYFRTTQNSYFQNPVRQNQYHIKALADRFLGIPIYSIIVFTNPECDLRVKCQDANITICKLRDLYGLIASLSSKKNIMDIDKIDAVFKELSPFSPMLDKTVNINEQVIPFYEYIHDIIKEYNNQKMFLESAYSNKQKELRKGKIRLIIGAFIACIICIILCVFISYKYKASADKQVALAQKELNDFAQKFERVKAFNEGDLSFSHNLVTVSDVLIEPSKDIDNTILVQFALKHTGNDYGIRLNSESSIILILNDDSVMECKIYNEKYPYSDDVFIGNGSTCTILPHEFYNISIDDINYVKLSNVDVWTYVSWKQEIVLSGYEVEVFVAD